jgi:hypothetical protein
MPQCDANKWLEQRRRYSGITKHFGAWHGKGEQGAQGAISQWSGMGVFNMGAGLVDQVHVVDA